MFPGFCRTAGVQRRSLHESECEPVAHCGAWPQAKNPTEAEYEARLATRRHIVNLHGILCRASDGTVWKARFHQVFFSRVRKRGKIERQVDHLPVDDHFIDDEVEATRRQPFRVFPLFGEPDPTICRCCTVIVLEDFQFYGIKPEFLEGKGDNQSRCLCAIPFSPAVLLTDDDSEKR